jgi:hypothetical protein
MVNVGGSIRYTATPTQTGVITRKDVLRVCSLVVRMDAGPLHTNGETKLYICSQGDIAPFEATP